ncbi:MAG TPA: hypothetical protein ENI23_09805 [bacterium]|nr:hypothetical protein [bacterium]
MKQKRQYTKIVFHTKGAENTGMMCRLIKNKKKGRPFDVIEIFIKGYKADSITFRASPEEALEIAWGLIKSVWHFLQGFEPYQRFRMKGSKVTKYSKKSIWWSI